MRAKGWMLWVIYSWGIVEEHREWEEREENQRRNSIKNKVNSGRKAERLEMKKSTSRRERNPCTWWRPRKMSPRRRNSIMSEWDGKSNKGRKERQPSNGHIRKSSHQQWGFLLQPGALIIASQLCHCRAQMWSDQIGLMVLYDSRAHRFGVTVESPASWKCIVTDCKPWSVFFS